MRSRLMASGIWCYTIAKEYGSLEISILAYKLKEGDPIYPDTYKIIRIPHLSHKNIDKFYYLEGTCMEDIVLKEFKV